MANPLHSRNLVPFKKRLDAYDIPGLARGNDEISLDQVDHDLSPEEQSFIRHYLGYADTLLNGVRDEGFAQQEEASQSGKVTELPDPEKKDPNGQAA
jgi:hypothetical protein